MASCSYPLSRRQFLAAGTVGIAGAAVLGPGLLRPTPAFAATSTAPRPIPGGFNFPDANGPIFHTFAPAAGQEPSTIYDFDGVTAFAQHSGTGVGRNLRTGKTRSYVFDTDMRFMQGTYVDMGGRTRHATFGFL